jgi:hypothetical protein
MTSNQASAKIAYVRSLVYEHLQSFWPESTIAAEQWEEGPIQDHVPGLQILRIKSRTPGRPVIYATNGCFILEPNQHIRHEFFLISPEEERRNVETLTMLADFHADEQYRVDVGSVVNIGDPWLPGSLCDHLLLSVPYPYGPRLEWLKFPDTCVRFLWALPITAREAAFAKLNGYEALEQKFEVARVDYMTPSRASIV